VSLLELAAIAPRVLASCDLSHMHKYELRSNGAMQYGAKTVAT
jgi:hypothetical protein